MKNLLSISVCLAPFLTHSVEALFDKRQDTVLDEDGNEWAVIESAKFDRFIASSFHGDSLDFRGREVRNAAIVDSSIEGIQHLTVESIAIRQSSTGKNGHGPAIIDSDGVVSTTPHMRWNAQSKELRIPALGSFGSKLEVRTDVDFRSHIAKNIVLEPGTELSNLSFKDGVIENSILRNVTAVDLNLGDVAVETVSINDFANKIGAFVAVANDGKLEASPSMKSAEGQLLIEDDVIMSKSLQVKTDLQVSGEAYLEGSLAVAGSVLGGGPYVDISDKRYKRAIQDMNSSDVLDKLLQLKGVSYELDTEQLTFLSDSRTSAKNARQFGFIAQDVEALFPELVHSDEENDFKGLHYSRFVPLLVEGLKQLTEEVRELQELNKQFLLALKDKQ
eukprot:CAMPEP_0201724782 /NCGR_PEP_ID=MMETSP0593-20130828/8408_1 /ASSEMBLY_ACC=CAM_ASM_000672 /TAXON_ID=267983 /ORGANISM="Skeletonema japonicum, Strain CCMP2506" /LENGTH=389 /DNA_ID=CAMNT_0048216083 /DNA_START=110 /DNA_END=1279 /DNA_ORIENTATION=-